MISFSLNKNDFRRLVDALVPGHRRRVGREAVGQLRHRRVGGQTVFRLADGRSVVLLLVLVVRQPVAELPVVHPVLLQRQVEHRERRIAGGVHA